MLRFSCNRVYVNLASSVGLEGSSSSCTKMFALGLYFYLARVFSRTMSVLFMHRRDVNLNSDAQDGEKEYVPLALWDTRRHFRACNLEVCRSRKALVPRTGLSSQWLFVHPLPVKSRPPDKKTLPVAGAFCELKVPQVSACLEIKQSFFPP